MVRSWLLNPPVIAGAAAVALRLLGVDIAAVVSPYGPAVGSCSDSSGSCRWASPSPRP